MRSQKAQPGPNMARRRFIQLDRNGRLAGKPPGAPGSNRPIGLRTPGLEARSILAKGSPIAAPSAAVIALTRATFGPKPGDVQAFNALGNSDSARIQAWVSDQLTYENIDDSDLDARLGAPGFSTLNKSVIDLWQDHIQPEEIDWEYRMLPFFALQRAAFMRAAFSKRQLYEVLVNFWHTHFSIYGDDSPNGQLLVATDRDVIRPNALGNFRDMLVGVAQNSAMLFYLDNAYSSQDGPNENYAREVLELHTLGAENYYGYLPWEQVAFDGQGRRVGYVEDDVAEFTRCLTGWSIDGAEWDELGTGEFMFRSDWHDQGSKRVLGQTYDYSGAQPLNDCLAVLDMLAEHPGTAGFVCRKLCRRLVSDEPPEALISAAAEVFHDNWQASDQIARVVEFILNSDEFRTTWGEKIKRPFETITSAMRILDGDVTIMPTMGDWETLTQQEQVSNWFTWEFLKTGHMPHTWGPPNGFPDVREIWQSSSALVMTWRTIQMLVDRFHDDYDDDEDHAAFNFDVVGQTLQSVVDSNRTPRGLANHWYERILGYPPTAARRDQLARILTYQNYEDPAASVIGLDDLINLEDNLWPAYNHWRLRSFVALILMSPEFMYR